MSKEIVISTIILIIIIIANIWVSHFIDEKLNYIVKELDELESALTEENYSKANDKLDEIDDYFNKSEDMLSCYIEHDELEKVKTEFTSLKTFVRFEKDDSFESLDKMRFIIRHIEEKDDLKLKNVL